MRIREGHGRPARAERHWNTMMRGHSAFACTVYLVVGVSWRKACRLTRLKLSATTRVRKPLQGCSR